MLEKLLFLKPTNKKRTRRKEEEVLKKTALCFGIFSLSRRPPPLPLSLNKKTREEEEEGVLKPPLCFHAYSSALWEGSLIRLAGAAGPGLHPGTCRTSSGLHQSPAGRPRETAFCLRSRSPETRLRGAPTHSQRSAYPAKRREKRFYYITYYNLTIALYLLIVANEPSFSPLIKNCVTSNCVSIISGMKFVNGALQ